MFRKGRVVKHLRRGSDERLPLDIFDRIEQMGGRLPRPRVTRIRVRIGLVRVNAKLQIFLGRPKVFVNHGPGLRLMSAQIRSPLEEMVARAVFVRDSPHIVIRILKGADAVVSLLVVRGDLVIAFARIQDNIDFNVFPGFPRLGLDVGLLQSLFARPETISLIFFFEPVQLLVFGVHFVLEVLEVALEHEGAQLGAWPTLLGVSEEKLQRVEARVHGGVDQLENLDGLKGPQRLFDLVHKLAEVLEGDQEGSLSQVLVHEVSEQRQNLVDFEGKEHVEHDLKQF